MCVSESDQMHLFTVGSSASEITLGEVLFYSGYLWVLHYSYIFIWSSNNIYS